MVETMIGYGEPISHGPTFGTSRNAHALECRALVSRLDDGPVREPPRKRASPPTRTQHADQLADEQRVALASGEQLGRDLSWRNRGVAETVLFGSFDVLPVPDPPHPVNGSYEYTIGFATYAPTGTIYALGFRVDDTTP
jgi:hypothetical protein